MPTIVKRLSDDLCVNYQTNRCQSYKEEWLPNQPTTLYKIAISLHRSGQTECEFSDTSYVDKDIQALFLSQGHNNESPKRIIIEGAPGVGKTVLAKEIAYQWAKGNVLQDCILLFLLYLRDPKLHFVKSIDEILELFTSENSSDLMEYVKQHSKHIAFVFDGFNEYPISLQCTSYITDIIKGTNDGSMFLNSTVVVTTRPTTTLLLQSISDRRVEIIGFCKEERDKCVSASFDDRDVQQAFETYLRKFPVIKDLCYIPLHLTILKYLFQQGTLPETLTEIIEAFILHTICHFLKKNRLTTSDTKRLNNLPGNVLKFVYQLSQLAFEGLCSDQLVFTCEEIKKVCSEVDGIPESINGLGLLQAVEDHAQVGVDKITSASFHHFTMQEYLAALHVSTLPSEKQSSLMTTTFWHGHFSFMWMMYVGIVGVKSITIPSFAVSDTHSDKIKYLHLFQCYVEASSNTETSKAISFMFTGGEVMLNNITLLPYHVSSLVYFLSASSLQQWKVLKLNNCNLGDVGMNSLLEHFIKNISTLEYVDLSGNNSSPWVVYCAIIKNCCVNSLTLSGDEGMKEYVEEISDSLQTNTTLQSLTVCKVRKISLKSIKNILVNNTLRDLKLYWEGNAERIKMLKTQIKPALCADNRKINVNILFGDYPEYLSKNITLCKKGIDDDIVHTMTFGFYTIKKLNLSHNKITDAGAFAIADSLRWNTTLKELNLSNNQISIDGMKNLSECVHTMPLKCADLSGNNSSPWVVYCAIIRYCCVNHLTLFGDEGMEEYVKEITHSLQTNTTLQSLTLCKIGIVGMVSVESILVNNTTLNELNLSWGHDIKGTKMLTKHTPYGNSRGVKVNILYDDYHECVYDAINLFAKNIDDEAVYLITFGLHNNKMLRKLDLSYNNITADGMEKLAECFEHSVLLEYVDLSGNRSSPWGVYCTIITCCCVDNLTLFGDEGMKEYIKEITGGIEANTSLKSLTLCKIGEIRLDIDVNVLIKNIPMKDLILPHSSIITGEMLFGSTDDTSSINRVVDISILCNSDYIFSSKIINLSNTGISEDIVCLIAIGLYNNKSVQKVNLSHNNITNIGATIISDALRNNNTIRELNLSHNQIGVSGMKELAKFVHIMPLEYVDLSGNKASPWDVYCAIIKHCCVKSLTLCGNKGITKYVKKITNSLQANTMLHSLTLCVFKRMGWSCEYDTVKHLLHEFKKRNYIEDITIIGVSLFFSGPEDNEVSKNNRVVDINIIHDRDYPSKGLNIITEAMQANAKLQKLDISHNSISDDGVMVISDCLKMNNTLQEIDLSWNRITNKGATKTAKAIQANKTLCKLCISHNNISNDGMTAISDCLKINNVLQELNLSWNKITSKGAKQIAEAIKVNATLQKLDISHNSLSDDGVITLSDCLMSNSTLQELDLSWNRITSKGAQKIAEVIQVNTTLLQKLTISHNSISDDGLTVMSDNLKMNNTLHELDLSWNRITSEGAKKIAEAIQVNTTLRNLDISHNSISDDGVMIISDSLKSNCTLQELDFSWNKITNKGAKKIAEVIQVNTILQKLNVSHNSISDDGMAAISDHLKSNNTLQQLDLSWNRISNKGAEKIIKADDASMLLNRINVSHNSSMDIATHDYLLSI